MPNLPRHQGHELLRFFRAEHLPKHLRLAAEACAALASGMDRALPDCAEKTAGLRKLLEAKDCFVRACLPDEPAES